MLETQYLVKLESLGVEKKVVREFSKFWDFPPILTQKWPNLSPRPQDDSVLFSHKLSDTKMAIKRNFEDL